MAASERRGQFTYRLYRTLSALIEIAPEWLGQAVGLVVGEITARRPSGPFELRVRHVERVLASRSPAVAPDPAVVHRWARRSFRAYARYWVEGGRLPAVPTDEVVARITIERGYEHLQRAMASGTGMILALPHVGSWEWGGAFLAAEGIPMTAVAERIEPPAFFDWLVAQRRAMGLTIVPLGGDSSRVVLRTLRQGGLVGLVCDRDIEGHGVPVTFFGEVTTLPAGPATLALRTGATLCAAAVYSGPGPFHVGVIMPPIDTARRGPLREDVARVTAEIARQFEQLIFRAPEQWHLYQPNWPADRVGAAAAGCG
ncbi:MAG: phosphatidylinositol mannoside acyltransferase [Acidimicrobiales bacterium]